MWALKSCLLLLVSVVINSQAFVPVQPVLSTLARLPAEHPIVLAVLVTSIKTGSADLLAQRLAQIKAGVNKKKKLDKRRLSVFAVYGGIYLGVWQHYLFSHIYTTLFPMAQVFASRTLKEKLVDYVGMTAVLKQVLFETVVHWPWLFIPAFYVFQSLASPVPNKLGMLAEKLRTNWKEDVVICWKVWIPAMLVNFSSVPLRYQVPYTAVVGFFYMSYFSIRRGGSAADAE